MRLNKKSIIIGGTVVVILFLLASLAFVGCKKKNDEERIVDNSSKNVTVTEGKGVEVVENNENNPTEAVENKDDTNVKSEEQGQDQVDEDDGKVPASDNGIEEQTAGAMLTEEEINSLLCSSDWYEIGKYTYLALSFSENGTFNLWDTVGNPSMKGSYAIDTRSMQLTLDCTGDEDFDPPFEIPKASVCTFRFTEDGYLHLAFEPGELLFRLKENVKADKEMKGYVWIADSASDGSDVNGLRLSLGNYFALYNEDTIFLANEVYSVGTEKGYITVGWSSYGNMEGEYKFTYSILPYVAFGSWDLSDKTLSIEEATDTFEEDMKLQFPYTTQNDVLELEYDGVTITFTRGEDSSEMDEIIYQKQLQ